VHPDTPKTTIGASATGITMRNYQENPDYKPLYETPIEQLELSEKALLELKLLAVYSVGDCLDYFITQGDATVSRPFDFREIMDTEVKEKLKKHDYWSFYEKYR
jgi:hypothetical protein